MKKTSKFFALLIVMVAFSAVTFAQVGVTATATASATIITPIAIANNADMAFGNVAVNNTPGTVVMTPAAVRSVTGGCTLPATTGTVTAARFTVSGLTDATYAITLPAAAITMTGPGLGMTVSNFTSSPSVSGVLTGGSEVLTVGATLNVAGSQAAGNYTSSAPFTVRVDYN